MNLFREFSKKTKQKLVHLPVMKTMLILSSIRWNGRRL